MPGFLIGPILKFFMKWTLLSPQNKFEKNFFTNQKKIFLENFLISNEKFKQGKKLINEKKP